MVYGPGTTSWERKEGKEIPNNVPFFVLSVSDVFCLAGLTAAELSGRQAGNEDSPRSI